MFLQLFPTRSALLNAGYNVSSSHCEPAAVKTNAPFDYIWDIMRLWVNPSVADSSHHSYKRTARQ
jgi:hypothetical protein